LTRSGTFIDPHGMHRTYWQRDPRRTLLTFVVLGVVGCSSSSPAPAPAPAPPPRASGAGRPAASPPAAAAPAIDVNAVADDLFDRTNAARRAAGLTGLARSVNLTAAAQLQADQMVKVGRMDHVLSDQPFPTLKTRLAAVQYGARAAGENIGEGQRSAGNVMAAWMDSSRHRANILSKDYTELGTGVAAARNGRLYFVAVFARPGTPTPSRAARPD
jgi:uncharacterized protein YkwD